MKIIIVRYHGQPIKFGGSAAKRIAEVVPVSMASRFADHDLAYAAAQNQWGDVGMQHVSFDDLGVKTNELQRRGVAEGELFQ